MKFGFPCSRVYYDWICLLNSYKKFVKKNHIVLEIGASNLQRTKDLVSYCKKLIGVELFSERIPQNIKNITYIKGDWQRLRKVLREESIDIAINNQVIEHVPDDLRALNELYCVLKPEGVALICTPNRTRLLQRIIDILKGEERTFPWGEHVREYTEGDIVTLVKRSKFKKYKIIPHVFGIHAGPFYLYSERVPEYVRKFSNFLEIQLFK